MNSQSQSDLLSFIQKVENSHFRTIHDTGANENTMFIWNLVRKHAGLPRMKINDLRKWCDKCKKYHKYGNDNEFHSSSTKG